MLTVEKLEILLKVNWDSNLFLRGGSAKEQSLLADINWSEYAGLLQDLMRISKNLFSTEYARAVRQQLLATCVDKESAQMFIGYASTL
ncbi:MAG TPA: hypothetical protein VF690_10195 [Hymenobacter sp.]|jgi:hypothetical protein